MRSRTSLAPACDSRLQEAEQNGSSGRKWESRSAPVSYRSGWHGYRLRRTPDARKVRPTDALPPEVVAKRGTSPKPSDVRCHYQSQVTGSVGILRALPPASLSAGVSRRAQLVWRFPAGLPVLEFQPWEGSTADNRVGRLRTSVMRSRPLSDSRRPRQTRKCGNGDRQLRRSHQTPWSVKCVTPVSELHCFQSRGTSRLGYTAGDWKVCSATTAHFHDRFCGKPFCGSTECFDAYELAPDGDRGRAGRHVLVLPGFSVAATQAAHPEYASVENSQCFHGVSGN